MAHPSGVASNLFDVLADWSEVLKYTTLGGLQPKPELADQGLSTKKIAKPRRQARRVAGGRG